jgi:hypothetical protein
LDKQSWLRAGILAASVGAAAFWAYAVYHLIATTSSTGGGMELVAIVPMTIVFAALTLPALVLAHKGRHLIWAAGFLVASILANSFLWRQILIDLAPG